MKDQQTNGLHQFACLYPIIKASTLPARTNPILGLGQENLYQFSDHLINLLDEVCHRKDQWPLGESSYILNSSAKQKQRFVEEIEIADEDFDTKSDTVSEKSHLGKASYSKYFASGKNKIETGCCVFLGNEFKKKK